MNLFENLQLLRENENKDFINAMSDNLTGLNKCRKTRKFENLQLMTESLNNVFYHRSMYKNLSFDTNKSEEIGLHCGTLEQANEFPGIFLYKLTVDTSKMCTLKNDVTSTYGGLEFLHELLRSNVINKERFDICITELRSNIDDVNKKSYYSQYYRKLLNSLGFTGFIYPNEVEGDGNSICIIDSSAIRNIVSISDIILAAVKKEISESPGGRNNKNARILREDWDVVTIYIEGPEYRGFYTPSLFLRERLPSPPGGYEYVFHKVRAAQTI